MPVYIHAHTMRIHTLKIRHSPIYAYVIIYITTEIVVSSFLHFFTCVNFHQIRHNLGVWYYMTSLPSCFSWATLYTFVYYVYGVCVMCVCAFYSLNGWSNTFACSPHKPLPQNKHIGMVSLQHTNHLILYHPIRRKINLLRHANGNARWWSNKENKSVQIKTSTACSGKQRHPTSIFLHYYYEDGLGFYKSTKYGRGTWSCTLFRYSTKSISTLKLLPLSFPFFWVQKWNLWHKVKLHWSSYPHYKINASLHCMMFSQMPCTYGKSLWVMRGMWIPCNKNKSSIVITSKIISFPRFYIHAIVYYRKCIPLFIPLLTDSNDMIIVSLDTVNWFIYVVTKVHTVSKLNPKYSHYSQTKVPYCMFFKKIFF